MEIQKQIQVISNSQMLALTRALCLSLPQLNPDVNVFQRKFVNEVRRCEEMDRELSE